MPSLKAAAASTEIPVEAGMVFAGGILPGTCPHQEAPLRAGAVLIEADTSVCIVSCDVLALTKDLCDEAATRIADACGIPTANVLITATHTHHAPSTVTVHGYERDEGFCGRVVDAVVAAATRAHATLRQADGKPNEQEAELQFACGIENTVGQNSRWHTTDGQVTWYGQDRSVMVRPSGPHDPDMPVLALRRPSGELLGTLFCHGTHNIGTLEPGACSPGIFGLAAQELERQHQGTFLFAPGAFGSSHRMEDVSPEEGVARMVAAVQTALGRLQPALVGPVSCAKRPFTCTRRTWDEAEQDAAVRRWCEAYFDATTAAAYVEVFAASRGALLPLAGQPFDTWLQVIRLGDVAIVGIPGEMFASLGLEIRQRSPFRNTVVIGNANDELGYIPDRRGYGDGGYQTWVGLHSVLEPGTGERMVEEVLAMLQEAYAGPRSAPPTVDLLSPDDASALQSFYNSLPRRSRWLFRPMGWNASLTDCAQACADAASGSRFDLVLRAQGRIVAWAFLVAFEGESPHLGIAVADAWCGGGHGRRLMEALIAQARACEKMAIELIHVKGNEVAGALYRKLGFEVTGEHTGPDGNEYWEMRLTL